jgi:hypothetical protein
MNARYASSCRPNVNFAAKYADFGDLIANLEHGLIEAVE